MERIEKITKGVQSWYKGSDLFKKIGLFYTLDTKEEAQELEAELESLPFDVDVERVYTEITVRFEVLDDLAKLMKKYSSNWGSMDIEEKQALYEFLPDNENDVRFYFERGIAAYELEDYIAELRGAGFTAEEIIRELNKADIANNLIISYSL